MPHKSATSKDLIFSHAGKAWFAVFAPSRLVKFIHSYGNSPDPETLKAMLDDFGKSDQIFRLLSTEEILKISANTPVITAERLRQDGKADQRDAKTTKADSYQRELSSLEKASEEFSKMKDYKDDHNSWRKDVIKKIDDTKEFSGSGWGVELKAKLQSSKEDKDLNEGEITTIRDLQKELSSKNGLKTHFEHETKNSFEGDHNESQVRSKDIRLYRLDEGVLSRNVQRIIGRTQVVSTRNVPWTSLLSLKPHEQGAEGRLEGQVQALQDKNASQHKQISALKDEISEFKKAYERQLVLQKLQFDSVIPRGLAVAFFGKDVPPGWQLITRENRWRVTAVYLADSLRGQSMPDLEGVPLIGTNRLENVGKDVNVGKVVSVGAVPAAGLGMTLSGGAAATAFGNAPNGSSVGGLNVYHEGKVVGGAVIHPILNPAASQVITGEARATVETTLTRGTIPGVQVRWIVYVGLDSN